MNDVAFVQIFQPFESFKELDGHSKNSVMSIHNLVAYLIGWGQLVLKWNDRKSQGHEVDFPETGFKWNELGKMIQLNTASPFKNATARIRKWKKTRHLR